MNAHQLFYVGMGIMIVLAYFINKYRKRQSAHNETIK